jgi:hypothetical protein
VKLEDLDAAAAGPVQGEYPDDDDDAPLTAAELLEELEDLIERPELQYARDTLEGIYDTVEASGRVSKRQLRTVNNIEAGAEKRDRYR